MIIGNDNSRENSRSNLTLDVAVKNDIFGLNLNQHLTIDKTQWFKMIYIANSNRLRQILGWV